jgi:hypothetical protein
LNRIVAPLAVFVIAAAAYAWLGVTVSHVAPMGVDAAARGITGEWTAGPRY